MKKMPAVSKDNQFKKITPCNGFDCANPDNAKQNSYAWSMAEFKEYIYVGTARNVLLIVLESGLFGNLPIPPMLIPQNLDMNAEIWRYKKDGSQGWTRVYKSPPDLGINGFRFMIPFTTLDGQTALYAGGVSRTKGIIILKSTDGINWKPLQTGIIGTTRSMAVHNGKLFMGVLPLNEIAEIKTMLYVSLDPEKYGWAKVDLAGNPNLNPRGNIDSLLSWNNHLYVGTSLPTGFELWRTKGLKAKKDQWVLVVDRGAGDALNQFPIDMDVFNNYIYVGTAAFVIRGLGPGNDLIPPKGFDIVRVNANDKWEIVVGGDPIIPTQPTTGTREKPLSKYPSGFGNLTDAYCWQVTPFKGELYVGSFDWSVIIPELLSVISPNSNIDINNYIELLLDYLKYLCHIDTRLSLFPVDTMVELVAKAFINGVKKNFGFDLWKSKDGIHWQKITKDGFGNSYNYGTRNILSTSDGKLFIGTANPFQGCEVWVK
ncbi:hypothetical protein [Phosphitispora sp. TUW77]|uniref:hypothetical protein n=1 Tax=Phosphitispora sp. TUW77 TaxID=3152361 RepID=UPI003AB2BAAB